ncbi:sodium:proton symporter [Acuticoccus mangrovi]|uniref:Sodium:proton symporter n=1 Tax=Acuticoccus mangrovi TaxID=2796142 RepID=A0A934MEG1_9HYPH|nr:sodium:proton symporter [Acuticoccus mangrovi]MBJ3777477.1 sodium:proton symporter [Acuticoccus mangrovi]
MGPFTFISRNSTRIIAGAALLGLVLPGLADALRPFLGYCVLTMLTVSMLRVDVASFFARVRRPLPAICAGLWLVVVFPLTLLCLAVLLGPPFALPLGLTIIFIFVAPPPIVSAPAFAMLMGLDGALVLAVTLIGTVVMPITAPTIASFFVAETMPISAVDLALRLALMISASFALAFLLRRLLGPGRVAAARPVLDTVSVVVAIIFALGAMDGVGARLLTDPGLTLGITVGSFAFALAQMALTYAVFRPFVGVDAVAMGYAAGNRNAGLVVAALGVTQIDDMVWLIFALSQLPIFFFPMILKPLGRRLVAAHSAVPNARSLP